MFTVFFVSLFSLTSSHATAHRPGACDAAFTEVVSADGRTIQRVYPEVTIFSSPRSSLRVEVRRVPEPGESHMRLIQVMDADRVLDGFREPVAYLNDDTPALRFSGDGEHLLMSFGHRTIFSRPLGRRILDHRYERDPSQARPLDFSKDAFFLDDRTLVNGLTYNHATVEIIDLATEAIRHPLIGPLPPDVRPLRRKLVDGLRAMVLGKYIAPPPRPFENIDWVKFDPVTGWAIASERDPNVKRAPREMRHSSPDAVPRLPRITIWDLKSETFAPHEVDLRFMLGLTPYSQVHEQAHAEDVKAGRARELRPVAAITESFDGIDAIGLDEPGAFLVLARIFAKISWPGDPTVQKQVERYVLTRVSARNTTPDMVWLSALYAEKPGNLRLRRANGGIEVYAKDSPETSVALFSAE